MATFALTKWPLAIISILCTSVIPPTFSHGRLIEPPSRASAWRYGFDTPHNYNDHELYCGGFSRQWQRNAGRCGVCGDAWDLKPPRPHEYGGTYGSGVIVRQYRAGQLATLRVELTASHFGYFEFAVCPQYRSAAQSCFDQHRLHMTQDGALRYYPRDGSRIYEMQYRLPANLTCAHCTLQWRYVAGNNWGMCPNGTGTVGCGPQEEFRACADIRITPTDGTAYDDTPDDDEVAPPSDNTPNVSIYIALLSFFAICFVFCLIFCHFYPIGGRLWRRDKSCAQQPPLAPPRGVRRAPSIVDCPNDLYTDAASNSV